MMPLSVIAWCDRALVRVGTALLWRQRQRELAAETARARAATLRRLSGEENDRSPGFEDYDANRHPLTPGCQVYLRTVTMQYTGRVVAVDEHEILLEDTAWIADGTQWSEMLKKGGLSEVEPYPDGQVAVRRSALVDAAHWMHPLPREAKC
jgi:hypothetical protein